jgi:hypothetical protein
VPVGSIINYTNSRSCKHWRDQAVKGQLFYLDVDYGAPIFVCLDKSRAAIFVSLVNLYATAVSCWCFMGRDGVKDEEAHFALGRRG